MELLAPARTPSSVSVCAVPSPVLPNMREHVVIGLPLLARHGRSSLALFQGATSAPLRGTREHLAFIGGWGYVRWKSRLRAPTPMRRPRLRATRGRACPVAQPVRRRRGRPLAVSRVASRPAPARASDHSVAPSQRPVRTLPEFAPGTVAEGQETAVAVGSSASSSVSGLRGGGTTGKAASANSLSSAPMRLPRSMPQPLQRWRIICSPSGLK